MFADVFSYDRELADAEREKGIIKAIQLLAIVGTEKEVTGHLIMQKYELDEDQAKEYVEKYHRQ